MASDQPPLRGQSMARFAGVGKPEAARIRHLSAAASTDGSAVGATTEMCVAQLKLA